MNTQDHIDNTLHNIADIKEQALSKIEKDFKDAVVVNSDVEEYYIFFERYLKSTDIGEQLDLIAEYRDKLDYQTVFNSVNYMDTLSDLFNLFNYSLVSTTIDSIVNILLSPIRKGYNHNPVLDTIKALYNKIYYHKAVGTYFNLTAPDQSKPHYWITLEN